MKKILLLFLLLFPILVNAQTITKFASQKYHYSFNFSGGFYKSDKIFSSGVDAKIVDGNGSSFIVTVVDPEEKITITSVADFSVMSDKEIKDIYEPIFGDCELVKRGTYSIDNKSCYYFHIITSIDQETKLYHKVFILYYNNLIFTIEAASYTTRKDYVAPDFALMLTSFKFN